MQGKAHARQLNLCVRRSQRNGYSYSVLATLMYVQGSGYLTACFAHMVLPGGYVLGIEKYADLVASSLVSLRNCIPEWMAAGSVQVRHGNILGSTLKLVLHAHTGFESLYPVSQSMPEFVRLCQRSAVSESRRESLLCSIDIGWHEVRCHTCGRSGSNDAKAAVRTACTRRQAPYTGGPDGWRSGARLMHCRSADSSCVRLPVCS